MPEKVKQRTKVEEKSSEQRVNWVVNWKWEEKKSRLPQSQSAHKVSPTAFPTQTHVFPIRIPKLQPYVMAD